MDNLAVKTALNQVFGHYVSGFYNGIEATKAMDELLDGIKGLNYKSQRCLTVDDGNNRYSINISGLSSKQIRRVESDLVPAMHIQRQYCSNGYTQAHIGKGCSTKHYRNSFNSLVGQVALQYGL
jgi:hypothetical protein